MTVTYPFVPPQQLLKQHGLAPKKSWGQNFLISERIVDAIAQACDVAPREVVEIGGGTGVLTRALLSRDLRVTVLERDPDMVHLLRTQFAGDPRCSVLLQDAASFDFASALQQRPRVVAGNLPYHLTGVILDAVLRAVPHFSRAVFMVQREVGERIAAPPGSRTRGALSAVVEDGCTVHKVINAKRGAFFPPPKVDSVVLALSPRTVPLRGDVDPAHFRAVVHAAFGAKRKTVRNALTRAGLWPAAAVAHALEAAGIAPDVRAESLPVQALGALAAHLPAPPPPTKGDRS